MDWIRKKSSFLLASSLLGSVMLIFLYTPIVGSLVNSATGIPATVGDQRTISAISTSFYCAMMATIFTLIFGVPLAYLISRYEFPGKQVLDSILDLPILIPHNAAGIALLLVVSPGSFIGKTLATLGIRFVDTIYGVVISMAFVSAPFMIRSAQDAFASIDPKMEKVARSLGATQSKTFFYVTLPLAYRGILTGCLLTWARAVSEFGAVVVLAYYPKTVPVHLFDVFLGEGLKAALPINGLLMVLALLILILYRSTGGKRVQRVR